MGQFTTVNAISLDCRASMQIKFNAARILNVKWSSVIQILTAQRLKHFWILVSRSATPGRRKTSCFDLLSLKARIRSQETIYLSEFYYKRILAKKNRIKRTKINLPINWWLNCRVLFHVDMLKAIWLYCQSSLLKYI